MKIDEELIDALYLNDNFNLSNLWALYQDLEELKTEIEKFKEYAIKLRKLEDLKEIENKLYFINRNMNLIQEIMEIKELDILNYTPYGEICLN